METTNTYPVPRILWESLEATFNNEARRYIKDLAACLNIPADTLTAKVLPKKSTVKVYLQDSPVETEELSCHSFVAAGAIAARCRAPVLIGTNYCNAHQHYRPEVNRSIEGTKKLFRLAIPLDQEADYPTLWYDESGTVYDCNLAVRGHYNSTTGTLQLFIM